MLDQRLPRHGQRKDHRMEREHVQQAMHAVLVEEHEADQHHAAGVHVVSGMLHADELKERTGFEMPEGDYETLAGFLLSKFERIPEIGQHANHDGWEFKVTQMDDRRIAEVLLVAPAEVASRVRPASTSSLPRMKWPRPDGQRATIVSAIVALRASVRKHWRGEPRARWAWLLLLLLPPLLATAMAVAKQDGKGIMTNIRYADGKDVQPTDEQVSQWRAAAANQ